MAKKTPNPRKTAPAKVKGKLAAKGKPAKRKAASAGAKAKSGAGASGGTSIDELMRIVPPPKKPVEAGAANVRPEVEKSLNLQLPDDLLEIGRHYGTGRFIRGFLLIFNPYSKYYRVWIDAQCDGLHESIKADTVVDRYSVFPESPGLLPLGIDENGGKLYWLTQGKPNQWPLILWAHGEKELYQWDMPLTTFFAKTFSNKTKCQLWDEPFKKKELLFQPEN